MSVVLSEHLPLLALAPDGIQKLRGLILELAVRGKLVPQDSTDESASELLKRIAEDQAQLAIEGTRKKSKSLPPLSENDKPFEIPVSWEWTRLGNVVRISTGKLDANAATTDGQYPFFTCSRTPSRIDSYSFDTDAVLLAGNGDFNIKYYSGKFDAYQRTYVIEPIGISLPYLYRAISQNIGELTKNNRGSAIPYLKLGDLTDPPFPIPPLAEQHRIVAKVDELMALCDLLEAKQSDAASAHARLVETLLGTLTESTDAADLAANWQRLAEHFSSLFSTEASVDVLKQVVLQLAVMGKLVLQDPDDEPASTLLKQIEQVRAQLVAEGVCKKAKPALSVSDDEQPFVIPENWHWSRLASLVSVLGDGLHGTPHYTPGTPYFFVNGNNLVNGEIVIKPETKTVSEAEFLKHRKPLSTSTVLVSINGSLGRVAFYAGEQVILGKSACFFNLLLPLNKRYIRLVLESPYFVTYAFRSATGTTIKNLGLKAMNDFPIPLPPIAEQHRIVAKVDELMALCERLKVDLGTARQRQAALADTLIESALGAA